MEKFEAKSERERAEDRYNRLVGGESETSSIKWDHNLIVAYNDVGGEEGGVTGYALSTDNGKTFTEMTLPFGPHGDNGDPSIGRDKKTGTIYLASLANDGLNIYRSHDGGKTFDAPIDPTNHSQTDTDKEWLTVDNAKGPGQGTVYVAWKNFPPNPDLGLKLAKSTDGGNHWDVTTVTHNPHAHGVSLVTGPHHEVYAFYLNSHDGKFFIDMQKSTDFGKTFGEPISVVQLKNEGRANADQGLPQIRSDAFPRVTLDQKNGNLYLVYADRQSQNSPYSNIFLQSSTDGGKTWTSRFQLSDSTTQAWNWQPAVAINEHHKLGVFWYNIKDPSGKVAARQETPQVNYTGVITSIDKQNAFRFTPYFPVSTRASGVGRDPEANEGYRGDYDVAIPTSDGFFTPFADARSGRQQVRIAHVNTHGKLRK